MIDTNSKTYCPLIFHGIYVERTSNGAYHIAPCSTSKKSQVLTQKIDFVNNQSLNLLRVSANNNVRAPHCQSCWVVEDNHGESKRQVYIDLYRENQIPQTQSIVLFSLDYNTLPICNAKCIICSPTYSSAWIQDAQLLNNTESRFTKSTNISDINKEQNQLDGLDLTQLKSVYFNGGEPLLTNDHVTILTQLQNINEVAVSYNINGSCYPTEDVLQLWSKAKEVTLSLSIDGINEQFEYIRNPLIWKQVSDNIAKLNNCLPNLKINIAYTVGLHNVFGLRECINWCNTNIDKFDVATQFHVHTANGKLDIKFAGRELRKSFLNELSLIDNNKFYWVTSLKNYVRSTVDPSNDWMDYLYSLDKIRNTNWETTFVELYENSLNDR
jgi:hypothetical protein